jgi:hypothetical protein
MRLLYLDDSGAVGNASDRHIILAGLAVFERVPYWLSGRPDDLAKELWPEAPYNLEFRGGDIWTGRKHWRGIGKAERHAAFERTLNILRESREPRLFGAMIHKAAISPDDPMEYAFEQVCNRFDRFLGRLHRSNDTQRGLIVLDESSHETSLQRLARNFRHDGHRWGKLRNLSEVPLFVDSRATRMIQYAGLIAYSLRQYYERGNAQPFDIISSKFDSEGGVMHGLVHVIPQDEGCNCLACRGRRRPSTTPAYPI